MSRIDLSDHLVHWTSGEDYEHAYMNIMQILVAMSISGSSEKIRGAFNCICFTEAPEHHFHNIVSRYMPFGIQIPKKWLFERGGRPVIYQSSEEYDLLPESMKWRHVRYEPNAEPPIDFTWEREWRIQSHELDLEPEYMQVIVPSEEWGEAIRNEFEQHNQFEEDWGALIYGEEYYLGPASEIPFNYSVINV